MHRNFRMKGNINRANATKVKLKGLKNQMTGNPPGLLAIDKGPSFECRLAEFKVQFVPLVSDDCHV